MVHLHCEAPPRRPPLCKLEAAQDAHTHVPYAYICAICIHVCDMHTQVLYAYICTICAHVYHVHTLA